jgi:hypothetical protein
MRTLLALIFAVNLSAADDPNEIVRRAFQTLTRHDDLSRNYTYLNRQEIRMLDSSGDVKHRESKTWDISVLEGSPYTRLIQRDDKALPAKEEALEQAKLERTMEARRQQTPEQRTADWKRRREARLNELKEVPDAFDLRIVGEETLNGEPAWIIEGTPRAGYKPHSRTTTYYLKLKGRMWVSKRDYQPVKIEAESIDTIAIGAFLLRLHKGARMNIEFAHVNQEVWLPKHVGITGSARVLLVKPLRVDMDYAFSNYKRFSAESRVVSTAQ